jgi:hypothetical protein
MSPEAAAWVQKNLQGWPKLTLAVAADLITKYGMPQESNDRQLTVNYRVPLGKITELVQYDGSLVIDRTRGELSVHCNNEQSNILTLNIADDIVKGDRNLEQALAYHAQVVRGVQIGEPESYPNKLRFKALQPAAETADADAEAPLLKHLGE